MRAVGRVVVITGASSGIARATALRFAAQHTRLVLASRRAGALGRLAELCEQRGAEAIAVPTDVTSEHEVNALAAAAVERFGRIDVWVNAAAVSVYSPLLTMPVDDFRRVLDVNVMGYVYGARAALNQMVAQDSGVLINVASLLGEIPQPYTAPYGMSKAAVRALGVTLRSELALQGSHVHVATVLPPTIDTPFFQHAANYVGREVVALPPVYPVELASKAIVRLAEKPRREVVLSHTGRVLFRQHHRTPAAGESEVALLTEAAQFSHATVGDTTGVLYAPAPDEEARESGGWHGSARGRIRRLLGVAAVAGLGVLALRRVIRVKPE